MWEMSEKATEREMRVTKDGLEMPSRERVSHMLERASLMLERASHMLERALQLLDRDAQQRRALISVQCEDGDSEGTCQPYAQRHLVLT